MSIVANLDAALTEIGILGFRAEGFLTNDDELPGVVVTGRGPHAGERRTFTTSRECLESPSAAIDWATVVASLASEVEA